MGEFSSDLTVTGRAGQLRAMGAIGGVRVRVGRKSCEFQRDPCSDVEKRLNGVPTSRDPEGSLSRLQIHRRNWGKATGPGDRGNCS